MFEVTTSFCAAYFFINLIHMTKIFIFLHQLRILAAYLDVPRNVALADETASLLVHTTLDGLDPPAEEVTL
jgi:hypothetical protein